MNNNKAQKMNKNNTHQRFSQENKNKNQNRDHHNKKKKASFMFPSEMITNEGFLINKISTHPVEDKIGTIPPMKT